MKIREVKKLLLTCCLLVLAGLAAPPAWAVDDVTVRLNGGANVAYIGHANTLEIWVRNDATFWGMETPFRISVGRPYSFNAGYGNKGYVQVPTSLLAELQNSVYVTPRINNASPDTISIATGNPSLTVPVHNPAVLFYTLQFTIDAGATPLAGGICIDNFAYNISGDIHSWGICRMDCTPPLYQGNDNISMTDPTAPPVCFDIVVGTPPAFGGNGDVNCDGKRTSSDIIMMVNYIFKGGAEPCTVPAD